MRIRIAAPEPQARAAAALIGRVLTIRQVSPFLPSRHGNEGRLYLHTDPPTNPTPTGTEVRNDEC